jgi:hypothetical protein
MTKRLAVLMLALGLGLGSPAFAQGSGEETPSELAKQGLERLLRAMEVFIEMIPEYEAPVLNENGDIIIRRKRPERPERPAPKVEPPEVDKTKT